MEDQKFPWLYVAMIFIAFVSWIYNRIQEASAARRQAREPQEEEWETLDEYRPPASAQPSPTATVPKQEPEPPQSLRDVFREIEKQMAEAKRQQEEQSSPFPPPARAPEPPAVPPPLPSTARTPSPPATASRAPKRPSHASSAGQRTVDAERAAGVIPQSARTARLAESQRRAYSHKRNTRDTSDALCRILRNRRNLRVAFLLKEILDEPKALRRE